MKQLLGLIERVFSLGHCHIGCPSRSLCIRLDPFGFAPDGFGIELSLLTLLFGFGFGILPYLLGILPYLLGILSGLLGDPKGISVCPCPDPCCGLLSSLLAGLQALRLADVVTFLLRLALDRLQFFFPSLHSLLPSIESSLTCR
ncbi:hypothetical protein [Corynebacterium casei]|uniref:hypothetical protein n=1 Tax=Corynebacterium casei TaxID=160386 RepID=UPI003FD2E585